MKMMSKDLKNDIILGRKESYINRGKHYKSFRDIKKKEVRNTYSIEGTKILVIVFKTGILILSGLKGAF